MAPFRKVVTLCFLILIISINVSSQVESDDYKSDTSRVNSLIELSRKILFVNPDSTRLYLDTIGDISNRIDYKNGLYNYYNLNGIIYGMYAEQDKAISCYREGLYIVGTSLSPRQKAILLMNIGLEYWRKFELDSAAYYYKESDEIVSENNVEDLKGKLLFDLGNILIDKENFVDASKKLFQARDLLTRANDTMLLTYLYGSIGVLYTKVGNFELALENYNNALKYDLLFADVNNLSNTYINIGQLYFNHNNSYDSALLYYRKSVEVAMPHLKSSIETVSNINTGNIFIEKKQYDSAYYYYERAYADPSISSFTDRYAAVLINIGVYYRYKLEFPKAKKYLESGVDLAGSFNLLSFKATGLEKLYEIDSIESNHIGMVKRLRELIKTRDSIIRGSDKQKIATLEFEKYLAKEKYDNELLQKENELNTKLIANQKIILWVFLIALTFMLFAIIRLIQNRKKIKRLLSQLSIKNNELKHANEELSTINDSLNSQRKKLNDLILAKDKFFSILGHDLKSPFNSLLGLLQLIDAEWDNIKDDEKRRHIKSLYKSSANTHLLLEDLLTWGRAQRGLLEYKPEQFNLINKIWNISELYDAQLKMKNIGFEMEIPDDMELTTDPRYLVQIIQNLVNNAIKFTPKGGKVSITAHITDGEYVICVTDNGIGIPKDKLVDIFNLDVDFNRPGTEGEKSTGMGLILIKEYANLINAKLSVSSKEQNIAKNIVGETKFWLTLNI